MFITVQKDDSTHPKLFVLSWSGYKLLFQQKCGATRRQLLNFHLEEMKNKLWVVVRQLHRQLGKHKNKLLNLWKNILLSLCEVAIIKVAVQSHT